MRYVKQRESNDCGVAALAMACDMTYEEAAASAWTDRSEGLNDDLVKDFLFRHDWAWQDRNPNIWRGGGYVKLQPWPPAPFANTHICFVEATAGWHYCVLDFDGRVRDPFNQERQSLAHPDYKRIAGVCGLFKIGQRVDSVKAPFFECPDCGKDCADIDTPHSRDCSLRSLTKLNLPK